MAAVAIGGGIAAAGIAGGVTQMAGSKSAAGAQTQQAQNAINYLTQARGLAEQYNAPWLQAGQGGIADLQAQLLPLTERFNPTMEQLAQTPGYQFTLQQGLQGTQNSAAAQGLGTSGQALAGAANYATGLASTTYNQQFANYWAQNQDIYNMLMGLSQVGQNAAQTMTNAAVGTGSNMAQTSLNLGNALAGSALTGAQGLGNALGGVGSGLVNAAMYNPSLFGGGASNSQLYADMSSNIMSSTGGGGISGGQIAGF